MFPSIRRATAVICVASGLAIAHPSPALAQSQVVPILTDQTPLPLSQQFGVPAESVINDSGTFAFLGYNRTAVFYRGAAESQARRVMQVGEPVAGMPDSRIFQFSSLQLNNSGLIAFFANVSTPTGLTGAILKFDGTTLTPVVLGTSTAPDTGGAKFESMFLQGLNSDGDMFFSTSLIPTGSTAPAVPTLFFVPAGGAPQRVVGVGDVAPAIGGTFTGINGRGLNNSDDVVFTAAVTGGTSASGMFRWNAGSIIKLVAQGEATPLGGTFGSMTSVVPLLNNQRDVAFVANGSIWVNSIDSGRYPVPNFAILPTGSAVPAPVNGTVSVTALNAFNDQGWALFQGGVTGGTSSQGTFRTQPVAPAAGTVEIVVYFNQPAPGFPGKLMSSPVGLSMNVNGVVSFMGTVSVPPNLGLYQQAPGGALTLVAAEGTETPAGGPFIANLLRSTVTLSNGTAFFRADITSGPADFAEILWTTPTPKVLMKTSDPLPPGAGVSLFNFRLSAAGTYTGFFAQRTGGKLSQGVVSSSGVAEILITDGDVVASADGRRFRNQGGTPIVNASGQSVLHGTFVGPAGTARGVLLGSLGAPPARVAIDGDLDSIGRIITRLNNTTMFITAAGQISFEAFFGSAINVMMGTAGAPPVKTARVQDPVQQGQLITVVFNQYGGPNASGQFVLRFLVSGAQILGLYLSRAGEVPLKLVQVGDASPGGGTFLNFANSPEINTNGDVVFQALVTGGPSGIFVKPAAGALQAVVLHGAAAPGGGTFSFATARSDVTINDNADIAFIADIAGGGADTGYFRRLNIFNVATQVEVLARQGDAAPGTTGVFATFAHTTVRATDLFQLNAAGGVAISGSATQPGSINVPGVWYAQSPGSLLPILATGPVAPQFGGGIPVSRSTQSGWMGTTRYPFWATLATGPIREGIFLYTNTSPAVTGAGSNVAVSPTNPATGTTPLTITFQTVTGAGTTSASSASAGPAPIPRAFSFGTPPAVYEATTTATFTGSISVCVDFAGQTFPAGAVLRLLHFENGAWVDVTSGPIVGTTICGTTTTLAPFAVVQALNVPTTNFIQNGGFDNNQNGWSTFDPSGIFAVNGGVMEYSRPGGTAVVLQSTGQPVAANTPLVATWQMGNSSNERKRFSVLIHNDFAFFPNTDLFVCTFYLPPNTPLQTYAMRTHTTIPWQGATISLYAASGTSGGGSYRLDNVVFGPGSEVSEKRTDCVDPLVAAASNGSESAQLIVNGSFSGGDGPITDGGHLNSPWIAVGTTQGTIQAQVSAGVAQFIRVNGNQPAAVLLQNTGVPVGTGQIVSARFELGNSSPVRKRVTVLMHDFFFAQLSACTFWLEPGQALTPYTMRAHVLTAPWSAATISFYPAVTGDQWFLLDNVAMNVTPAAATYGTDCVEPGDESGLGGTAELSSVLGSPFSVRVLDSRTEDRGPNREPRTENREPNYRLPAVQFVTIVSIVRSPSGITSTMNFLPSENGAYGM